MMVLFGSLSFFLYLCIIETYDNQNTMENTRFKISQYACAVLLIVSSIALVAYQVIMIDDVSNCLLVYVAQAFLLVASIFGLDYYVKLITRKINGTHTAQ